MNVIIILARILHIFSAVLWAGGFAVYLLHIQPALNRTMPGSQPFFLSFMKTFSPFMATVAPLTLLGGVLLYWNDSAGLRLSWITTPAGLGFTFGALCGIVAAAIGLSAVKPRVDRLIHLSSELAAGHKPPTPEQAEEMARLGRAIGPLSRATFALLGLALLGMVTARYL